MNSEYLLPDGSPRYGVRTEERAEPQVQGSTLQVVPGASAREAAGVGLQAMYFASRVRRYRPWTRGMHPMTAELVGSFPADFSEAGRIVEEELGSSKDWHKRLAKDADELRREAGDIPARSALIALGIVLAYFGAGITLIAVAARTDIFTALQGITLFILLRIAFVSVVRWTNNKVRSTHPLRLTATEREDLRLDIQLATFVEVLESKGVDVPPATAYRALSGFRDIQSSASAVAGMKIG